MGCTRILLADDDADHLSLLKSSLQEGRKETRVTTVSNREDFLTAIHEGEFDCVVLDYNLPPHTAPDLLRDLDRYQPGVPRIVVSSSEEQRVVIESVRQGAADFVQKHEAMQGGALWSRIDATIRAANAERVEKRALNRRLHALEQRSQLDPLTGVLNRRGAEAALDATRRHSDRRVHSSIIFMDLDHFKRVNDSMGHAEGDRVLRDAASVLREFGKGGGIVARWGGEEFILVRKSDTLDGAWNFADQIRQAIKDQVRLPDHLSPQTVSIGVDVLPSLELSVEAVRRADHAMYLAKENGRDRVCTWPMVRAIEAAHACGAEAGISVEQRLERMLQMLWHELGTTQRDHTGEHGRRVRDVVLGVAHESFTGRWTDATLKLASEHHDIGKVGVPEDVLALPRVLSADERRFINEHARIGADILRACGAGETPASIVERHHLRFDERLGIAERSEPTAEELVCACDAAVTIMSERPYSKARTSERMLQELSMERGRQFHPQVIDGLKKAMTGRAAA